MSRKRICVAMLAALAAVALAAVPASAHTGVAECAGTATVTDGLGFAVLDDSHADWTFTTTCNTVDLSGATSATLDASGTLDGGCGVSTGAGSGTINTSTGNHGLTVYWPTSAGTVLPVQGRFSAIDGHGSLVGTTESGFLTALVRASAGDGTPQAALGECSKGELGTDAGDPGADTFSVIVVAVLASA